NASYGWSSDSLLRVSARSRAGGGVELEQSRSIIQAFDRIRDRTYPRGLRARERRAQLGERVLGARIALAEPRRQGAQRGPGRVGQRVEGRRRRPGGGCGGR